MLMPEVEYDAFVNGFCEDESSHPEHDWIGWDGKYMHRMWCPGSLNLEEDPE